MTREESLASENDSESSSITLRIMVSSGDVREKEVTVNINDTVESLKKAVSEALCLHGKFLRLIAAGRMITPNDARLNAFPLKSGSVIHAVISTVAPRMEQEVQIPVAPEPESDSEEERRGFDRFRDHGVTREGVESLRTFFSDQVTQFAVDSLGVERESLTDMNNRDNPDRARLEDAWIAAHGQGEFGMNLDSIPNENGVSETAPALTPSLLFSHHTFDNSQEDGGNLGLPRDLIWGFLMGLFLGIIMLFWIWERSVSHRHKMGILSGVSCQLAIRYLKKFFMGHSSFGDWPDQAAADVEPPM